MARQLTLGTACILAGDRYVDEGPPREERGARRDSVFVRVVVGIVKTLREIRCFCAENEAWNVNDAGAFLRSKTLSPSSFP